MRRGPLPDHRRAPVWLAVCHCTECKRQSGSAFGMSLRTHGADVKLTRGEPKHWNRPSDRGGLVYAISAELAEHVFGTRVTRCY